MSRGAGLLAGYVGIRANVFHLDALPIARNIETSLRPPEVEEFG
jgi:hypothetical protein